MARRLALRVVPLTNGAGPSNGGAVPAMFSYAEMMQGMLRMASAGRGLSLDEVIKAVEALAPIEKAMEEGAEEVTLSDAQWRTLREKLEAFQFVLADPVIVEFGLMIRNAPEIT